MRPATTTTGVIELYYFAHAVLYSTVVLVSAFLTNARSSIVTRMRLGSTIHRSKLLSQFSGGGKAASPSSSVSFAGEVK